LGLEMGRLKTGTPPRLNRESIDFARFEIQPGDDEPMPFSYMNEYGAARGEDGGSKMQDGADSPAPSSLLHPPSSPWRPALPQVHCWLGNTNAAIHEVIRANLHRAPMYSGQIQSTGPRYCPSIEDKVVRFADKACHQIFLEPEGRCTCEYYCNGISTSLPRDVQEELIHSIHGLER